MNNSGFRWFISAALSFLATLFNKHVARIKPRDVDGSPFTSRIDLGRKYTRANQHFIVIATQKSGSTFLNKLINENGMTGLSEPYRMGIDSESLGNVYSGRQPNEAVGSTLHFDQMNFRNEAERSALFSYLKENEISVVFLIRGLSAFIILSWISQTIDRIGKALQFKKFTDEDIRRYDKKYSSLSDHAKFYLDRKYFIAFENDLRGKYEATIAACEDHDVKYSIIYYEDISESSERSKIFSEVFGIENIVHDVGMLKRHDNKLSDIIS